MLVNPHLLGSMAMSRKKLTVYLKTKVTKIVAGCVT